MALVKIVKYAYLLPHGALTVIDEGGKRVPKLEGTYSIEKHKRIMLEACDDCDFTGFDILPKGFHKSASDFANAYRRQNLNWDEIKGL